MNERQGKILNTIIREYIDTSKPVGSESIVKKYGLNISPASVRLDMIRLEKDGYIVQPHTSAGRIPRDKGYRWFIRSLEQEKSQISPREQVALKKKLSSFSDIEKTIKMAVHILSELTYCTALAKLSSSEIYYYGLANIMKQPEFEERNNILGFADLVDHLEEFLGELPETKKELIYIGEENPYLKKASCSIIILPYSIHEREGLLGLLGPTRMSYDRNIPLLGFVAKSLKEF